MSKNILLSEKGKIKMLILKKWWLLFSQSVSFIFQKLILCWQV